MHETFPRCEYCVCSLCKLLISRSNYGKLSQKNVISSSLTVSTSGKINLQNAVIYQIHLPSFLSKEDSQYYFRQLEYKLSYLVSLGVTTLQLFPVEMYTCEDGSDNCWNLTSIQYPGVLHPHFGDLVSFRDLVTKCHKHGLQVLLEVNWVFFDSSSIVYDCDCQGTWGSFFNELFATEIAGKQKLSYDSLKLTNQYILKILTRWRKEVGVDGIVWQYTDCLVYSGQSCMKQYGTVDFSAHSMIQMMKSSTDLIHVGIIGVV